MSVKNVKFENGCVYAEITGGEVKIEEAVSLTVEQIVKMLNGLDELNSSHGNSDDWTVLFMNHRDCWVAETDGGYSEVTWMTEDGMWFE